MNIRKTRGQKTTKVPGRTLGMKILTTDHLLRVFHACLLHKSLAKISNHLDVTEQTLRDWGKKWPEIKQAKKLADELRAVETFEEFVFDHLSAEAQESWDQIQFWDEEGGTRYKINEVLSGKSVFFRQKIFIHALISNSYDPSTAMRLTGVSLKTFKEWKQDPKFQQLIEEIEFHEKNWMEQELRKSVADGNVQAQMFMNKAKNSDRGYGDKLTLQHTGSIGAVFDLSTLGLNSQTNRVIIQAIQDQRATEAAGGVKAIAAPIDVSATVRAA